MASKWLSTVLEHVTKHPCGVIRLSGSPWVRLTMSDKGPAEFTIARPRNVFEKFQKSTLVFVFGTDGIEPDAAWFGIDTSRANRTTLDTTIRVANGFKLKPSTEAKVAKLISDTPSAKNLIRQLATDSDAFVLSPKVSVDLVTALTDKNTPGLMRHAAYLGRPTIFRGSVEMQSDALRVALKLFELTPADRPDEVYIDPDSRTAIQNISLLEDAVIQHDARTIAGLTLDDSDYTGRALFRRGDEELEVFTANKLPLEKALGVDLVYLNLVRSNVAMVQYKMLSPTKGSGADEKDWIYRPDDQLKEELKRMDRFAAQVPPDEFEYRLSPMAFYLKFVQRNGQLGKGILLPVDYFKQLQKDPRCKGAKGGLIVSYNSLGGRYIREDAFLSLVRHGLIGPFANTTKAFAALIQQLVNNNHAVIGAIARKEGTQPGRTGKMKRRIKIEDTGEFDL